jgi:hypothetical protein
MNINEMRMTLFKQPDTNVLPMLFKEPVDYMLVELQPVRSNPKMKALADSLQAWGFIRGICDTHTIRYDVKYVNASNKLRKFKAEIDEYADKKKYSVTKATSVDVVTKYLLGSSDEHMLEFLQSFTKKDDLCDALLQGFVWLDRQK